MAHTTITDAEMEDTYDFCVAQGSSTVNEIAKFAGRAKSSLRNRLMTDSRFTIAQKGKGKHVRVYPVARAPKVDATQPVEPVPVDNTPVDVPADVPLELYLPMFAIIPQFIRRDDTRIYIKSPRMTSIG